MEDLRHEWEAIRAEVIQAHPDFYELEPGGAIAMELGESGWMLELQPVARLLCQVGVDIEELRTLLSGNTAEDLSSDELQRVAKDHLRPSVRRYKAKLVEAGFAEGTEVEEEFMAITFEREIDFHDPAEINETIQWCRKVIV
ncbi:MAG TPA: hypothetical protein EYN18_04015 [Nitrospirales bacterium]|nr:hypothetical protein [Nitrospirales bacterium]HIB55258.1 hypothetical protein [Nitrospirales bacterium]HIO21547.1 hypothetical protein [Nitrospirales bacterium]